MKTTLKYTVEKNNYNNLHYAVIHARTESFQTFIDQCRGDLDEKVLKDLYKKMIDFITDNVQEGNSLDFDGLFTIQPVIKGKFTGKDDEFDAERHKLDIKITPDKRLMAVQDLENYKLRKIENSARRKK